MDVGYQRRVGATFREVINGLKRNSFAAAADLGVSIETVERHMADLFAIQGLDDAVTDVPGKDANGEHTRQMVADQAASRP